MLILSPPSIADLDREAEIRGENYLYELAASLRLDVAAIRDAIFPEEDKQNSMSMISISLDVSGNEPDS